MPAITKPNLHFDATLYTGTGSALSVTNGGFQPDWVWMKARTSGGSPYTNHVVIDSVRGAGTYGYKNLNPNLSDAEYDPTSGNAAVTALNSSGFTLGGNANVNTNTMTAVAWQWKAGGTAVTNTSGTISTQVSANPTAGFSVMTYTGNATNNATIGHGLGAVPKLLIWKPRASVTDWMVWHASLSGYNYDLRLNTTANQGTGADPLNNTAPGSSVVTLRNQGDVNGSGTTIVCYAFAEIAGYSAFGSYTGNGSADGPFVYTGFRPKFLMLKKTSNATNSNWLMQDTSRETYNASNYATLAANLTNLEPQVSAGSFEGNFIDYLSNGFKIRSSGSNSNESSSNYIYMAFAEAPQKYANAR